MAGLHRNIRASRRKRFAEFDAKWGQQYPAITRLWENAWTEFLPFLDYNVEIRRVICSELYPEVVDACEEEGGVPSRLIKTEAGDGRQEGTPWQMFAGSPSGRTTRVASRSMISLGRARVG